MKVPLMKQIAWCLVVAFSLLAVVPQANAGLAPSTLVLTDSERAQDIEAVRSALETKIVRERLHEFGFTDEEIAQKLSLLNDEDLHQLAAKADEIRVGGDGVLILVLVVAVVFLMYLIYSGKKVVVTK